MSIEATTILTTQPISGGIGGRGIAVEEDRVTRERATATLRGLLVDVRVASDCRSRGIGEQLVQWAVTEAKARGCNLVELLTHSSRVDAQRFYKRLGFALSHAGMTVRF